MQINLSWGKPLKLVDAQEQNLIYTCESANDLPDKAGIYVFVRKHGKKVTPLYVGQATSLRARILQQFNNAKLMMSIKKAASGHRFLLVGVVALQRGQQLSRVLDMVESAVIQHSLGEGHDLINIQGTKTPVNVIKFKGNRTSRRVTPITMHIRKHA
jgi:hypothetical protein